MNTHESEILNQIREVAHNSIPQGGYAILYGSRARGDAHTCSDWYVLILLDKDRIAPSDYDSVSFPFVYLGWNINEEINPIMYTKKEWNDYSYTPFHHNVEHDGIILWDA